MNDNALIKNCDAIRICLKFHRLSAHKTCGNYCAVTCIAMPPETIKIFPIKIESFYFTRVKNANTILYKIKQRKILKLVSIYIVAL